MFWGLYNTNKFDAKKLAKNPNILEVPKGEMLLASCVSILRNTYGFITTVENGYSCDTEGNELPLYTYPTIEYLIQFDFSKKKVFEFGAGASTKFWMKQAQNVHSVENNQLWFNKLKPEVDTNVTLHLAQGDAFPKQINQIEDVFDVIVVDGAGYRYDCAKFALSKLADDGLIILDNADWHHNTAAMLKKSGLLQIDMTGFKPGEHHTSTTSLFLRRSFDFPTKEVRQPSFGMGAKELHSAEWDSPMVK